MLVLNSIEVMYGGVLLILKGISIQVPEGGIIALLGSNGAGKSTTLKAISGLLKSEEGAVTDGSIIFDGIRIDNKDAYQIVKLGIVQVMEGRRIFEHLTTEENLRAGGQSDGGSINRKLDMVYSYFPQLKKLRNQVSGYLSGGEQQMLVIGRALMKHPRLLLLDEPSLGLAPRLVEEILGIVKRINEDEKTAILLVEQNATLGLEASSYGYVMENGKVVLDGPVDKLKANEDVKEFYLGLTEVGKKKSYRDVKHYTRRKRWLA
ncbi:MAG: ABC transporter ATP-binding protein [Dehalococcoidia bacterium]|nr:ABC transporter ATP-binding protein [Dehalococcoidia bacterium]